MGLTKVSFIKDKYGNYQDNWYTDDYETLITTLESRTLFSRDVNLGVSNGVIIENNFNGDFQDINCAIVDHDQYGKHLYKLIKKSFIKRDLWRITMVKDMVSSRYSDLLDSKVLVSRLGISRTEFDPLLFQKDILDLSEVKKGHDLLSELGEDKSYGFLAIWARDSLDGTTIKWQSSPRAIDSYDYSVTDLDEFVGYGKKERKSYNKHSGFSIRETGTLNVENVTAIINNGSEYGDERSATISFPNYDREYFSYDKDKRLLTLLRSYNPYTSQDITEYDGKTIYESSTGNYYEVKISADKTRDVSRDITYSEMLTIAGGYGTLTTNATRKIYYSEVYNELEYTLIGSVPTVDETLLTYVNAVDQPFQLFYIPIIEGATVTISGTSYELSKDITEAMLYDLIADYSGDAGKLLDVQLIPYSPVDGLTSDFNGTTKVLDVTNARQTITVGDYAIPMYEVLYCSYQLSINYSKTVTDYKIEQKRKYLITSPSGATVYDFSVAKNKGLAKFYIYVDIRPYATFHKVQPVFTGLYGGNYKDTRGLIWQEDTSLTMTSSAWETYKRQNINYMSTFNTEQNYKRSELALNQQANWGNYGFDAGKRMIEATVDAVGFAAEAVANDAWFGIKGGISGGAGAAMIMGGAIATEALESSQLAYNNRMDSKILENQISVARQQFNYNLGNIKAIPENLEKVNGVFNTNNYVPYVQMFEPTDEEISYYQNYLDLYGVNVGMLVDLSTKEFDYLQGTVVVYEGTITNEEYGELYHQLSKGVRKVV